MMGERRKEGIFYAVVYSSGISYEVFLAQDAAH